MPLTLLLAMVTLASVSSEESSGRSAKTASKEPVPGAKPPRTISCGAPDLGLAAGANLSEQSTGGLGGDAILTLSAGWDLRHCALGPLRAELRSQLTFLRGSEPVGSVRVTGRRTQSAALLGIEWPFVKGERWHLSGELLGGPSWRMTRVFTKIRGLSVRASEHLLEGYFVVGMTLGLGRFRMLFQGSVSLPWDGGSFLLGGRYQL